jgi:hypothetical protein
MLTGEVVWEMQGMVVGFGLPGEVFVLDGALLALVDVSTGKMVRVPTKLVAACELEIF